MLVSLFVYVSYWFFTNTHACALAHILTYRDDDGKRGTPRRWVEERCRSRETKTEAKTEDHLLHTSAYMHVYIYKYWHTRWLLCCSFDIWPLEGKSSLTFRSIPMTAELALAREIFLRSYGEMVFSFSPFFSISIVYFLYCFLSLPLFLINIITTLTLLGFPLPSY